MKIGIGSTVATLGLALLISGACTRQKLAPAQNRVLPDPIYSTSTGCDVDYPEVNLVISMGHQLWWQSLDRKTKYVVIFRHSDGTPGSGTPFKDSNGLKYNFPVDPTNGNISPVPSQSGRYTYTINDGYGNQCKDADPGVIVKD